MLFSQTWGVGRWIQAFGFTPVSHHVSSQGRSQDCLCFSVPRSPPVLGSHSSCCNLLQLSACMLLALGSPVPHVSHGRKTTNAENSYFWFLLLLWNWRKSAQYSRALLTEFFFFWRFPVFYPLTSEINIAKELHSLWRLCFMRLRIDRKCSMWCN